jgi:N-acyl-D-aspartate/D-glutamate deacylase
MTSFPAEGAGLENRGVVKVGFPADLVVFDLAKVQDLSTYEEPRRYSPGFPFVAVNGVLVVDGGKITGAAPGQVLWGPGKNSAPRMTGTTTTP